MSSDDFAMLGVTEELRDELRVAKAKRGVSYDTLIRENLDLDLGLDKDIS